MVTNNNQTESIGGKAAKHENRKLNNQRGKKTPKSYIKQFSTHYILENFIEKLEN